ncbi:MAG: hypothetical protein WB624_27920 [Xanthobacteraceae bacterium]|jgi:hypothetical protein
MGIATLRLILTAAAIVLLMGAARAQGPSQGAGGVTGGDFGGSHHWRGNSKKVETAKPKTDEKGYKAALDQLPDKQYDAWHGVR